MSIRTVVVAAFAALASLLPSHAAENVLQAAPSATLSSYRELALDKGHAVTAVAARFGRLDLQLDSGHVWPVKNAAGELLGFEFEGAGSYRYHVDTPEGLLTFKANAAKVSSNLGVGSDTVYDRFGRATVLFAHPAFAEVVAGAATEPVPDGAASALQAVLKWNIGFDHVTAEARLNARPGEFVYAEFEGKAARVGYEFDSVRGSRERLFGIDRSDWGAIWNRVVSEMIPATSRTTIPFSLEHAAIKVDSPDNRRGSIASTLRLHVYPGTRVLTFELVNHRDPRTYGWSSETNALHVRKVTDEAGNELPFSHRYNELLVDLRDASKQDPVRTIKVESDGEIFTATGGTRGDNYVDMMEVAWFPLPMSLSARHFTFDLSVRTKKPFLPVSTGDRVSLTEDGDHYVLEAKSEVPVWTLALFAGKYESYELKGDRWTVRTHAYGVSKADDREKIARTAAAFLEIYEKLLGPYPFKELEIVEVPSWSFSAVSPAGLVVMTSRTFKTNDAKFDEYLGNRGVNAMIAHEIAHQWFGHKAWPLEREDAWLNESVAEYMAGMAMGIATQGVTVNRAKLKDFRGMLEDWRSWNRMVGTDQSIAAASTIGGDTGWIYRAWLLYNRGPLVLHMLRTLVGDERFLAILRQYLADANGAGTGADTMSRAATKVLGMDMAWFFDQWFRQPGIPAIKVEQAVAGTTLTVKLTQDPARPFKKIHVPFVLEFPDGHREVKLAFQQQPTQEFTFPLGAAPSKVVVDPARNNLADYR